VMTGGEVTPLFKKPVAQKYRSWKPLSLDFNAVNRITWLEWGMGQAESWVGEALGLESRAEDTLGRPVGRVRQQCERETC
jgi:hypothetical protein